MIKCIDLFDSVNWEMRWTFDMQNAWLITCAIFHLLLCFPVVLLVDWAWKTKVLACQMCDAVCGIKGDNPCRAELPAGVQANVSNYNFSVHTMMQLNIICTTFFFCIFFFLEHLVLKGMGQGLMIPVFPRFLCPCTHKGNAEGTTIFGVCVCVCVCVCV